MSLSHAHTLLYVMMCGSLFFVVTFMYQRNGAKYKFFPSFTAFLIAAKSGVELIETVGSIVLYQSWPSISPFVTILLAFLLTLAILERGNVARILGRLTFVRATN